MSLEEALIQYITSRIDWFLIDAMAWHELMYGFPIGPPDPRRTKEFEGLRSLLS